METRCSQMRLQYTLHDTTQLIFTFIRPNIKNVSEPLLARKLSLNVSWLGCLLTLVGFKRDTTVQRDWQRRQLKLKLTWVPVSRNIPWQTGCLVTDKHEWCLHTADLQFMISSVKLSPCLCSCPGWQTPLLSNATCVPWQSIKPAGHSGSPLDDQAPPEY